MTRSAQVVMVPNVFHSPGVPAVTQIQPTMPPATGAEERATSPRDEERPGVAVDGMAADQNRSAPRPALPVELVAAVWEAV